MSDELDTGDVISKRAIQINENTYIEEILRKAEADAPFLFEEALDRLFEDRNYFLEKGSEKGLRCYPRLPEDGQIDWKDDVVIVHRLIRATSHPYKGAFSTLNGEKIIIWKADIIKQNNRFLAIPGQVTLIRKDTGSVVVACKDGMLEIKEIEMNGKLLLPAEIIKSIRVRFK